MTPPRKPDRRRPGLIALDHARSFVDVTEDPLGSNRGPLIDKWNRAAGVPVGSAWCMSFARAMFKLAGVTLGGGASVGNFEQWAKQSGEVILVRRPLAGDLGSARWDTDDWPDHVFIVEKVLALRWKAGVFVGWVQTIGGNESNMVRRQRRWISRCRFVRVT